MGTRCSLPRSTSITGKIAVKTQHPRPPGTPPVTPTGRPEQPTAFDPQSPLTLPTPHPIFPQAKELPAPINPRDNIRQPSSMLPTSMKLQNPWTPTPMTTMTFQTPPTTKKLYVQTGFGIAHGSTCQRKRRRNNGRRVMGCTMWTIDGEDYRGPDPDIFSTLATLLHAMILTPDSPPVHLPSHSSTNLLLHTTLPFTDNPIPTLVDSGATNNFIDESLAPSLTLCLDRDNPTDSRLIPFDVSPSSKNSETTIDHLRTPPQLCSRSAWSFIINVQLNDSSKVFPALVDSGASGTFVSNQLGLQRNDLNKPLELQLFDRSSTMIRITQYHDNTLTLDNNLQFQAWLLVTQLPLLTPIMLRLLWLQDVNPDIDWKNLTMQFPSPKVSLAAAILLCLQSISDSDISHPGASTFRATQSPSTSDDNPNEEGDTTLPWSPSITL
ncbi:hypothetical protein E4T56_gene10971 [Termitomyces sp. T112]|nr:hypothetical protein E4T56_gene10971 [Termitomyces sp. T112]